MTDRLTIASLILPALIEIEDARAERGRVPRKDDELCLKALQLASRLIKYDWTRKPAEETKVVDSELWQRYEKRTGNKRPEFAWN